jgi:hypothetical protein
MDYGCIVGSDLGSVIPEEGKREEYSEISQCEKEKDNVAGTSAFARSNVECEPNGLHPMRAIAKQGCRLRGWNLRQITADPSICACRRCRRQRVLTFQDRLM